MDVSSPRTAEACQRLGILAQETEAKSLDTFAEKNLLLEFQQQRCEHYEHKRQVKIHEIELERENIIIEQENTLKQSTGKTGTMNIKNTSQTRSQQLVIKEQYRLKKLELRQQKEFQQLIEYELKMQRIQAANQAKLEQEQDLQRKHNQLKQKNQREWERLRKQKERESFEEERQLAIRAEELAAKMFEDERKANEKRLAESARARRQQQKAEKKRLKRSLARSAALEEASRTREKIAAERLEELNQQNENRQHVLENQRKRASKKAADKARRQRDRFKNAQAREAQMQLQKASEIERKTALSDLRAANFVALRDKQLSERKAASEARMHKVASLVNAKRAELETMKEMAIAKTIAAESHAKSLELQRWTEKQRKAEIERTKRMDWAEAAQRQQRIEQYKRQLLMIQIEKDNETTKEHKLEAEKLADERRKIALDARRKKDELTRKVAAIKSSGTIDAQTLLREFNYEMPVQEKESETAVSRSLSPPRTRIKKINLKPAKKSISSNLNEKDSVRDDITDSSENVNKLVVNESNVVTVASMKYSASTSSAHHEDQRRLVLLSPLSKTAKENIKFAGAAYGVDVQWLLEESEMIKRSIQRRQRSKRYQKKKNDHNKPIIIPLNVKQTKDGGNIEQDDTKRFEEYDTYDHIHAE